MQQDFFNRLVAQCLATVVPPDSVLIVASNGIVESAAYLSVGQYQVHLHAGADALFQKGAIVHATGGGGGGFIVSGYMSDTQTIHIDVYNGALGHADISQFNLSVYTVQRLGGYNPALPGSQ